MKYLVMQESGPDGDRHIEPRASWRWPAEPDYAEVRTALERRYPGADIRSPMQPFPREGRVVTIYTSKEQSGEGRSGTQLHEWAVAGAP